MYISKLPVYVWLLLYNECSILIQLWHIIFRLVFQWTIILWIDKQIPARSQIWLDISCQMLKARFYSLNCLFSSDITIWKWKIRNQVKSWIKSSFLRVPRVLHHMNKYQNLELRDVSESRECRGSTRIRLLNSRYSFLK